MSIRVYVRHKACLSTIIIMQMLLIFFQKRLTRSTNLIPVASLLAIVNEHNLANDEGIEKERRVQDVFNVQFINYGIDIYTY